MSSDALYNSCIDETVKAYWQTQAPVYQYLYEYKGDNSMVNLLVNSAPTLFPTGVCHGDELFLLFNLRIIGLRDLSPIDSRVANRLVTLWTDFAKHGVAPKMESFEYPKWPKFDPDSMYYYRIGEELQIDSHYRQSEAFFWTHHLRNVSGQGGPLSMAQIDTRPLYRTLAWSMMAVSLSLFILILILLGILYFQRRRQSFRAQTPASSHLSAGSTLY